jgi:hypothetical protein
MPSCGGLGHFRLRLRLRQGQAFVKIRFGGLPFSSLCAVGAWKNHMQPMPRWTG